MDTHCKALGEKLLRIRQDRGWSAYRASKAAGLSQNMLRTMEGRNPRRAPQPWNVSLRTVLSLVSVYWPELSLADFAPQTPFEISLAPYQRTPSFTEPS